MKRELRRFGTKLRALRKYHGMTLKELADALGYTTHGYISELETGKKVPTAEFVIKLARLFKIPTDQLLNDRMKLDLQERQD